MVWFNGILWHFNFVAYLMLNPVYIYIYIYKGKFYKR